mmetsp:Transcript_87998/g.247284  ORF Transcript_87998/g.247284 Transcript_87998/m.247284 type:complete len:272 (-) Transcript_87998:203-1018(-)
MPHTPSSSASTSLSPVGAKTLKRRSRPIPLLNEDDVLRKNAVGSTTAARTETSTKHAGRASLSRAKSLPSLDHAVVSRHQALLPSRPSTSGGGLIVMRCGSPNRRESSTSSFGFRESTVSSASTREGSNSSPAARDRNNSIPPARGRNSSRPPDSSPAVSDLIVLSDSPTDGWRVASGTRTDPRVSFSAPHDRQPSPVATMTRRRVCFCPTPKNSTHPVTTPYARIYGQHPAFFDFDRYGRMQLNDRGVAEETRQLELSLKSLPTPPMSPD